MSPSALSRPLSSAHIRAMSKPPKPRTPKDPARPTRAKAARPPTHPIGPALADLLNPAINRGEAGVGSQTGLQPPPDNSRDRRADFSAAHRARKSTPAEFGEVPQSPYRDNAELREASPELARALGLDGDESDAGNAPSPSPEGGGSRAEGARGGVTAPQRSSPPPGPLRGPTSPLHGEVSEQHVVHGDRDTTVRRPRPARPELSDMGVAATANSPEKLLPEVRREFREQQAVRRGRTSHRPHRP